MDLYLANSTTTIYNLQSSDGIIALSWCINVKYREQFIKDIDIYQSHWCRNFRLMHQSSSTDSSTLSEVNPRITLYFVL